jgi:hypothetical protein
MRDEYYSTTNWFRDENRNSLYYYIISVAELDEIFNALNMLYIKDTFLARKFKFQTLAVHTAVIILMIDYIPNGHYNSN